MDGFDVGARDLFGGVETLEGEDGEAVEDEAGGLGMERRVGPLFAGGGEEEPVHGFNQVVAALIEGIDSVFDRSDLGVGGAGFAGLVFFVPQIEVGAVMGECEFGQYVRIDVDGWG